MFRYCVQGFLAFSLFSLAFSQLLCRMIFWQPGRSLYSHYRNCSLSSVHYDFGSDLLRYSCTMKFFRGMQHLQEIFRIFCGKITGRVRSYDQKSLRLFIAKFFLIFFRAEKSTEFFSLLNNFSGTAKEKKLSADPHHSCLSASIGFMFAACQAG